MKNFHNIDNEEIFKNFIFDREIRPATVDSYRNALQKYSDFTNKTLNELIKEAEIEEEDDIRLKRREINRYLRDFEFYLKAVNLVYKDIFKQKLSIDEINSNEHNLKSFNDVKAFFKENKSDIGNFDKLLVANGLRELIMNNDYPNEEKIERFSNLFEKINKLTKKS